MPYYEEKTLFKLSLNRHVGDRVLLFILSFLIYIVAATKGC